MNKKFIPLILLFFGLTAMGQSKISGAIKDNKGKPIPAISVTLKGTYDGSVSDSSGNFSFTTSETGAHMIEVTGVGYHEYSAPVELKNAPVKLDVVLKERLDELKAVVVTAGAFEAGDKKRAATVLSSLDIATTAGSNADITAALKTLPGAQQVGHQEGLFVRGGTGDETKQFIDGTVLNNPFFTSTPDIASRGRFSPFLFKGTVFSTGGYSALYGQALSSAVILESIDLPEETSSTASISPILLGGGYQKLTKNKKTSWGASYNYVNVAAYFKLVPQLIDYFDMPEFHSGDANFRIKTKGGGMIKYYTTFSYNHLGLRRPDIDSVALKDAFGIVNHSWYNNLSWKENLGNGWKMNLGFSYSTNRDDLTQELQNRENKVQHIAGSPWAEKNFHVKSRQDLTQIKQILEKKLGGLSAVRFGGEYWYASNPSTFSNNNSSYKNHLKDNYAAAFAETDIYLNNATALKIGSRYEYSSILKKANIAPRISLAYKTGANAQVSLAYGIFYQKPLNNELLFTNSLDYTKATHYIANYQKTANDRIFRVEAFYKKYDNLVKTYPSYSNNGSGYAKGFELFLRDKRTVKNLDYWISYSYLDSKRDYLNYPDKIQPYFVAPHTLSIVTKRFITEWKAGFNITYTYSTGRPYYNFRLNNGDAKYFIADQGKTKDYHNVGFSAEYLPTLGNSNAKTNIVLFASVTNVLGTNQVYGYNYSYNGMIKQAITPPAKRFYFIGVFLSWGIDRSQDAINNNL
jgi:hypothetical protein